MATETLGVTFDGVTDVPRLTGQSAVEWFDKSMAAYSLWYSGPEAKFAGTANLTGSDWKITHLRMAGDNARMVVKDLDSGADRQIKILELGYNSKVDFLSTRAQFIFGWDGDKHEVTLGNNQVGSTFAVNLFAAENILTTGNAWVGSVLTGLSDSRAIGDTIVIGSGGAGSVRTSAGKDAVTTGTGEVGSIWTGDKDDSVTVGSGGVASVRTGDGNDMVDATGGWSELISTGAGDDMVKMGAGSGGGFVRLGSGDDTISVMEMGLSDGVTVHGGSGVDTINFAKFTKGVTFTLDSFGIFQNVTNPGSLTTARGWFSEVAIDNIIGTNKGDTLTGDQNANELTGRGGKDVIKGGAGDDKLDGGGANDKLFGEDGKDVLIGGKGRDVLVGGGDNDTLRGNGGKDVFVFGPDSGTDKVMDFADGSDILRISGHSGKLGGLTITDQGANLKIVHDGGVIILAGEAGTTLTMADFDFV